MSGSTEEPGVADVGADEVGSTERGVQAGALSGERAATLVHRMRSLESRASSVLAGLVVGTLGLLLLVWYYSAALHRPAAAAERARAIAASRVRGDAPIPALPSLALTGYAAFTSASSAAGDGAARAPSASSTAEATGGEPAPPLPAVSLAPAPGASASTSGGVAPPALTPAQRNLARRLSGPTFARQGSSAPGGLAAPLENPEAGSPPADDSVVAVSTGSEIRAVDAARDTAHEAGLAALLHPALTPTSAAQVLPTQRLLLAKGAFIDCTLETAIDSSLPGMTTCITATDTFSTDGTVVLLERGTKLVGETRGEVQQGGSRVFVLWSEARTPTGVVIQLDSPVTDELGRSGATGNVDRHFWQRFGAALLISVIDAGAAAEVRASGGSTLVYSPTATQDVVSEVLKDSLRIAPTITKNQGDRIQVLVARDLDFRSVYELRAGLPR